MMRVLKKHLKVLIPGLIGTLSHTEDTPGFTEGYSTLKKKCSIVETFFFGFKKSRTQYFNYKPDQE